MTQYEIAIIISIICLAIHALFWEGMIFHKIGGWIEIILCAILSLIFYGIDDQRVVKMVNKIMKPIYDCLICMSSFWTLIIGHFYFDLTFKLIPVTMLIVCGINVILDSFIYYLRNGNNKL